MAVRGAFARERVAFRFENTEIFRCESGVISEITEVKIQSRTGLCST